MFFNIVVKAQYTIGKVSFVAAVPNPKIFMKIIEA
jgi:hypothetical protein